MGSSQPTPTTGTTTGGAGNGNVLHSAIFNLQGGVLVRRSVHEPVFINGDNDVVVVVVVFIVVVDTTILVVLKYFRRRLLSPCGAEGPFSYL